MILIYYVYASVNRHFDHFLILYPAIYVRNGIVMCGSDFSSGREGGGGRGVSVRVALE